MRVRVYWNLHRRVWSIQSDETRLVLGYARQIYLANVIPIVSTSGRARVLKTGRKNVHAYLQGELISCHDFYPAGKGYPGTFECLSRAYGLASIAPEVSMADVLRCTEQTIYNPWLGPDFTYLPPIPPVQLSYYKHSPEPSGCGRVDDFGNRCECS